jgi:hypothetical protein
MIIAKWLVGVAGLIAGAIVAVIAAACLGWISIVC